MQFEVRFGQNAVSGKMPTPPDSGMIQVNLADENTRVVELKAQLAAVQAKPAPNEGVPPPELP